MDILIGEREFVFILLALVSILFATNRIRLDIIALLAVLALMLSGILSVDEAVAGFGSPIVLTVAGLLVIGEMLDRTGVAQSIGNWILHIGGKSEKRLLILIILATALLGSAMSSTAIVAIFIPIILRLAATTNLNAARFLIPMSYAALISGMLTLIATPPNLVVSGALAEEGFQPLGFFSFTPIGLAVLVIAVLYFLLLGQRLSPSGTSPVKSTGYTVIELFRAFSIDDQLDVLRISADSPLNGKSVGDANLTGQYGVRILSITQKGGTHSSSTIASGEPDVIMQSGDRLLLCGENEDDMSRLKTSERLTSSDLSKKERTQHLHEIGIATFMIHPESSLIEKNLKEVNFRLRYGLHVLGIKRGKNLLSNFVDAPLLPADTLLVCGSWKRIAQLRSEIRNFILLELPTEYEAIPAQYKKGTIGIAILLVMVLLTVFNVVPIVAAVIIAVIAAVFTRTLTMEHAYHSIHWRSLVLLAGMLPLAYALEKTGGVDLIVDTLISSLGNTGPYMIMSALFFLTAIFGLFLANTAAAVLMAPIAITTAHAFDVSPYPFAVVVLIASSAAFVTPFSTPVVTLVVEPGRYRFLDFIKIGVPLLILTYVITILITPIFFPL